jgi:PKD repeat protein
MRRFFVAGNIKTGNMQCMKRFLVVALFIWSTSAFAHAAVIVNEIAWMGTETSGSDEWLELYNDGNSAIDLTGWTITSRDGSPSMALSGSIDSGSYFLIERTDDSTVRGIPADLVAPFGNGLSNEGETIYLKDASGTIVDTVVGGTNWSNIGGDNSTKETAQRTPSGWVTMSPTPRRANVSSGSAMTKASSETFANAGDDRTAISGVPMRFTAGVPVPSATYEWNFGDGATARGADIEHTYAFSGTYEVTLTVTNNGENVRDNARITVGDPLVSFNRIKGGAEGYVEIKNGTGINIDLVGWRLTEIGGRTFTFPKNSIITKGSTVIFPSAVTGLASAGLGVTLTLPSGAKVASWMPQASKPSEAGSVKGVSTIKEGTQAPATVPEIATEEIAATATQTASALLWERDSTSHGRSSSWFMWGIILGSFLLIAIAGFILMKSKMDEATEADEYAIIEDIFQDGSENDK